MTIETLPLENTSAAVEAMSAGRGEPAWMLELRQKAWRFFEEIPWPIGNEETWRRTKLTGFNWRTTVLSLRTAAAAGLPAGELGVALQHSLAEVESAGSLALVDGSDRASDDRSGVGGAGVIYTDLHTRAARASRAGAALLRHGGRDGREQVQRRCTTRCGTAAPSCTCRATSRWRRRCRPSSTRARASLPVSTTRWSSPKRAPR